MLQEEELLEQIGLSPDFLSRGSFLFGKICRKPMSGILFFL